MKDNNDKIKKGAGMLEQIGNSNRKTWDEIRSEFDKMTPEKVQQVIDECARRSAQEYPLTFEDTICTVTEPGTDKLGLNFSIFTIAPGPDRLGGTTIDSTELFVVKDTEEATWVRLVTNSADDYILGQDYLESIK